MGKEKLAMPRLSVRQSDRIVQTFAITAQRSGSACYDYEGLKTLSVEGWGGGSPLGVTLDNPPK